MVQVPRAIKQETGMDPLVAFGVIILLPSGDQLPLSATTPPQLGKKCWSGFFIRLSNALF